MTIRNFRICALVSVLVLVAPAAYGRRVPRWPWDKLFKEADVVLIVEATAVADSGENLPNIGRGDSIGVNTAVTVHQVIKGEPGDKVVIFHYRPGKDQADLSGYVSFDTSGPERGNLRMEYLVFLKKRTDGRFEPVSGTTDSDLSIRELHVPPEVK